MLQVGLCLAGKRADARAALEAGEPVSKTVSKTLYSCYLLMISSCILQDSAAENEDAEELAAAAASFAVGLSDPGMQAWAGIVCAGLGIDPPTGAALCGAP